MSIKIAWPMLLLLLVLFLLAACAPQAEHDIRGEWHYVMTDTAGNTYDDGTIIFDGEPARGTYVETNIYAIQYEGDYTVSGIKIKLSGDETWQGDVVDENTITGTWEHEDGTSGTFTATRN